MITGFFLQIFYILIVGIISLLPSVGLPSGWNTGFSQILGFFSSFSFLFPMPTIVAVLIVALSFHAAILILDFSLWIIHLIRGR